MKRIIFLSAFFLFMIPLTALHSQSKFCRVSGKSILARDGQVLQLKGINIGNWLVPEGYMFKLRKTNSPHQIHELIAQLIGKDDAELFWKKFREFYITEEDIRFIKACGLNSIRVPFHYELFLAGDAPSAGKAEGFRLLDRLISWCEKEQLYVILDMHCAPGGQTGDNIDDSYGYPFLFESEASQALTIKVWKEIAKRYKNKSIVLGYDLLNEPVAHYFDTTSLNKKLVLFYNKLVAEIRTVDKNHILFIGGAQWDSKLDIFSQPLDKNSVYTFHKYWTAPDQSVIQEYLDCSEKQNIPLWLGESGENSNGWIDTFRTVLEKNNIGWCFWPYKKMSAASCMLSIQMPKDYDSIIKFAEGPRVTFDDLRKNHLQRDTAMAILRELLDNIRFKNCIVNGGYLKALGAKQKQ